MMMKNKLLVFAISVAVLSPLALIFALTALSPFELMTESQNSLTVFEAELLGTFNATDAVEENINAVEIPTSNTE